MIAFFIFILTYFQWNLNNRNSAFDSFMTAAEGARHDAARVDYTEGSGTMTLGTGVAHVACIPFTIILVWLCKHWCRLIRFTEPWPTLVSVSVLLRSITLPFRRSLTQCMLYTERQSLNGSGVVTRQATANCRSDIKLTKVHKQNSPCNKNGVSH